VGGGGGINFVCRRLNVKTLMRFWGVARQPVGGGHCWCDDTSLRGFHRFGNTATNVCKSGGWRRPFRLMTSSIQIDDVIHSDWWRRPFRLMTWSIQIDDVVHSDWWRRPFRLMTWSIQIDDVVHSDCVTVLLAGDETDDSPVLIELPYFKGMGVGGLVGWGGVTADSGRQKETICGEMAPSAGHDNTACNSNWA